MQKARCAFFARNAHRTHKIYTHLVFILFWKNLSVFAAAGHPAPLHLRKMQKQMLDLPQGGTYKISFTVSVGQSNTLQTFYIVGVYKYTEDSYASMFGSASDDDIQTTIYIPIQTAKAIAGAAEGWQSLTAVAAADADVSSFVNTVGNYFASYYTYNDSWTVSASSLSSLLDSMTEMLASVSLGISAIAAISLLVGGIGVMNIMMVSVTERTREIGTRKALGAPGSAIRMQFITESVILCLIGGAIGILLGIAAGLGLSAAMQVSGKPSLASILVAFGFSMAIGVFFGYYPANKAARLDPIEALRYE